MNDPRSPLRRLASLAAVVLVALAPAGCAKKVTNVDATFTAPEGQPSADAQLIIYSDEPITVKGWKDVLPDGPDAGDSLFSTQRISVAPGTMYGTILDGTSASGYQVLRREGNGGYAQLKDYVLSPVARFLESQWELYSFSDSHPAGFSPPTYLGRGVVAGVVTPNSPLTNTGELMSSDITALKYTGEKFPADSNFAMSWEAVPNAAAYWIQIYQFTGKDSAAILKSAQMAPFVLANSRNFFIGRVAAPAVAYKLGGPGAHVLLKRTMLFAAEYRVRIVAVNERGELIAFSYGDPEYLRAKERYSSFPCGAFKVSPTRPAP